MGKRIILLDSNAYLRLGDTFHPLLHESFGEQEYSLYLIPDFQKEFDKSPRLRHKFGWANQPEYIENRKHQLVIPRNKIKQVDLTYTYLQEFNISEKLGASRIDVRALAYGKVLKVPVVTDDGDMQALGNAFGIEVWGLLDLMKIMHAAGIADWPAIKTWLNYLEYNKDLPFPSFKKIVTGELKK